MEKIKNEKGLLSLEACIVVTIFILFMLFMYSFFIVFEARNEMAHVILSSTDSLAMDIYEARNLEGGKTIVKIINNLFGSLKYGDNKFTSKKDWTDKEKASFQDVVRERVVAYLADGDIEEADNILENRYHIVNGLQGLDFSESKIDTEKSDICVTVKYTLKYEYNAFNLATLDMKQSACSKIWIDRPNTESSQETNGGSGSNGNGTSGGGGDV